MMGSLATIPLRRVWLAALAVLALAVMALGAAAAQAQAPAPRTGEVREDFEKWQLFCAPSKPGGALECEIHQLLTNQQGKLVAGMYLVRRPTGTLLMVRVPLGVALNRPLMLQIDNGIGTDALSFLRCDAAGCIAQMLATEPFLASLRKGGKATLTVHADANRSVPIGFTLAGFAAAEQALMQRAR
jgi:invasion protein IalB